MARPKRSRRRTTRRDTLGGAASVILLAGCGGDAQTGSTSQLGSGGAAGGSAGAGNAGDGNGAGSAGSGSATGGSSMEGPDATVQMPGPDAGPSGMCVARPAQTEGPFFVDENLTRADIRSDPSDNSVVAGVPLRLVLGFHRVDGAACGPIVGAVVDIWQCDALGVYSDVLDASSMRDTRGKKFLRGNLTTGADGTVEFLTIYPGWYAGRTVHIHFKIRIAPAAQPGHEFTSQLYFEESVNDEILALPPYNTKGPRSTMNAQDGIFLQGGSNLIVSVTKEAAGYAGRFDLGLVVP